MTLHARLDRITAALGKTDGPSDDEWWPAHRRMTVRALEHLTFRLDAWQRGEPDAPWVETEQDRRDALVCLRWDAARGLRPDRGAPQRFLERINLMAERLEAARRHHELLDQVGRATPHR
jgi:hypothetical protein